MGVVLVTKCIIITKHTNVLVNYSMFALRMWFSCQEWSRLRSKRPNRINNYIVIRFIHALRNHFLKMASLQKIYGCVPSKTIHSQAKYIIMDYCDQEAKKSRRTISLTVVSRLCYGATLSSFVVDLSEWTIMNIRGDYREQVGFSTPKRTVTNDMLGAKFVWL